MSGEFNLERFVSAQEPVFEQVRAELRGGCKESHWMWFVFPQITGLGYSSTAKYYSIASLAEAAAYLEHPVLGPRLRECTRLVNRVAGGSLHDIFGSPDDLKFRSSMTLFAHATTDNQVFLEALRKYCGGVFDSLTTQRLGG